MNILGIYQKYQIMPQLQEHQLKVAAVADLLVSNILNPSSLILDKEDIVTACLLHDVGNIIKFDLDISHQLHPELNITDNIEHWKDVKKSFKAKYGEDAHRASVAITKEIGVEERVTELVNAIGFGQGKANAQSDDFGRKICAYSDMRVSPKGVVSLKERMADLRARYQGERAVLPPKLAVEFEQALKEIEKQIFAKANIIPEFISEETIRPIVEKLKNFSL
jgi:hypothetical protein